MTRAPFAAGRRCAWSARASVRAWRAGRASPASRACLRGLVSTKNCDKNIISKRCSRRRRRSPAGGLTARLVPGRGRAYRRERTDAAGRARVRRTGASVRPPSMALAKLCSSPLGYQGRIPPATGRARARSGVVTGPAGRARVPWTRGRWLRSVSPLAPAARCSSAPSI